MEVNAALNLSMDFWTRQKIQHHDRDRCLRAIQSLYSEHVIEEFGEQGYCSYTLLATLPAESYIEHDVELPFDKEEGLGNKGLMIQLRPARHAFNLDILHAARITYSLMAPKVRALDLDLPRGLCAYEMEKLPGIPFSRLQPYHRTLQPGIEAKMAGLVTSFADLMAKTWPSGLKDPATSRIVRADSPLDTMPTRLPQCTGKVGSTITDRLQKLASELPVAPLRLRAQSTLMAIHHLVDYPVVLTHGDLIPSNILVDEDTWQITGMIDWAETEFLPFGMCLYGLEHLLGFLARPRLLESQIVPIHDEGSAFEYYDNAALLRDLFWRRLLEAVPELQARRKDVEMMRDAGVLLWRGIAWDDGAIDRVVNEVDDVEELAHLRAFLDAY